MQNKIMNETGLSKKKMQRKRQEEEEAIEQLEAFKKKMQKHE